MALSEAINSFLLLSIIVAFSNKVIIAISSQDRNFSSSQLLNNNSLDNHTDLNFTLLILPSDIDLNYTDDLNLTSLLLNELAPQEDGFNTKGEIDIIPISLFCLLALCFCFALVNDLV